MCWYIPDTITITNYQNQLQAFVSENCKSSFNHSLESIEECFEELNLQISLYETGLRNNEEPNELYSRNVANESCGSTCVIELHKHKGLQLKITQALT